MQRRIHTPCINHSNAYRENGEFIHTRCFTRDITERKQAEAAAARLAAIVASSSDAIIGKTLQGIITSWNASAERMFGYTVEEIIGESIRRLIPDDRREEEDQILMRLRAGELIDHYETVRVTKDGRHRDVSLTISPIKDNAGKIIGVSKIIRDITERKRVEEEQQRLIVRERTARAEAEEANRLKDEFLATVSHELRTPLNAILGWTTLLRRGEHDARTQRGLEVVERSALGQRRLIEDLLDVSRIVSGKMRLAITRIDARALLDAAVETMRPAAEAKGIEVAATCDEGLPAVGGDFDRLLQVIGNLVQNAVKFTDRGGRVVVIARRVDDGVE